MSTLFDKPFEYKGPVFEAGTRVEHPSVDGLYGSVTDQSSGRVSVRWDRSVVFMQQSPENRVTVSICGAYDLRRVS